MKKGGVQSQISENNKSANRPLVSVVIPVYNVEKYLRECVDSVINQTYRQIVKERIEDGANEKAALRFPITALSFASISIFPG